MLDERCSDREAESDILYPGCPVYTGSLGLYFYDIQWSLYFKTTHGNKKMWSYIAGGLKIKVI